MVFLLVLIAGSFLALTLLERLVPGLHLGTSLKGRITLALVFFNTGLAHFYDAEGMVQLVPPFLPLRTELVYATGVLEIMGAAGLLMPRLQRLAGLALILFLVLVFPGNIYGAVSHVGPGGHELGPIYLLARAPFQALLIWMLYRFSVRPASANPSWRTPARA